MASTQPAISQAAILRRIVEQSRGMDADEKVAQAAVCAAPILAAAGESAAEAIEWLIEQLEAWERDALREARKLSTQYSVLSTRPVGWAVPTANDDRERLVGKAHPTAHLYDEFLHKLSKSARKRHGVYFTPAPIATYIVANVDRLLREDFRLADGLGNDDVLIVDPACGTGVFLLTVVEHFQRQGRIDALQRLLPRLVGVEILPAAALLAKLNLAVALAATDFRFKATSRLNILAADALSPTVQPKIQNPKSKIPVVLGNPPFSSLSTNSNDWLSRLVRGDDEIRGYVRANGERLRERKTWLHDDYVKFIRLAQWHVEEAGQGIVAFVTNHGYLDNATFWLMRAELLRVFTRIEILDLHGNRKKHEISPDGRRDENVFGLDQGMAVSLFSRPPALAQRASEGNSGESTKYAEIWGSRATKLNLIAADTERIGKQSAMPSHALRARRLRPTAPDWKFVPSAGWTHYPEYEAGWSLVDAMPINATAPVTARDHFLVAFTLEELKQRIQEFRDLSISDETIRQRFFGRTRSARYQLGDTRGWKLDEARRIVAADERWQEKIVRCLYRPFDWRFVFWHPAMVDWPRNEVTRHLIKGSGFRVQSSERENCDPAEPRTLNPEPRCLIARRQQLPTQPCTFFWVSDGLALDGVIRSDNRGSESLFPLYVQRPSPDGAVWEANFAREFVESVENTAGLVWIAQGAGDLRTTFGPEDLLGYIYALFHWPTYRERYADVLRGGFPRVMAPPSAKGFAPLSEFGRELINLHLLNIASPVLSTQHSVLSTEESGGQGREWMRSGRETLHVASPVKNFRAGGYVALKKWLQPTHRSEGDLEYGRIAGAIARTVEIMQQIDDVALLPTAQR